MRGGGRVSGLVVYWTDWSVFALVEWFATARLGLGDRVRRWDERITENVVVSRSDCGVVLGVIHCGCITDRRVCRCVYYIFIMCDSGSITVVVAESWTR